MRNQTLDHLNELPRLTKTLNLVGMFRYYLLQSVKCFIFQLNIKSVEISIYIVIEINVKYLNFSVAYFPNQVQE